MSVRANDQQYARRRPPPGRRLAGLFGGLFGAAFLGISAAHAALKALLRREPSGLPMVFAHVPAYWHKYPYEYIAVVSVSIALLAGLWVLFWSRTRMGVLLLPLTLAGAGLLSCLLCGALWEYHDMLAGYFPEFPTNVEHVWSSALDGVVWGPGVILTSVPLNVIAFGLCWGIAETARRWWNTLANR